MLTKHHTYLPLWDQRSLTACISRRFGDTTRSDINFFVGDTVRKCTHARAHTHKRCMLVWAITKSLITGSASHPLVNGGIRCVRYHYCKQ
jgi:hypothetical protein